MLNFIISPPHKANASDNIREAGLQAQHAALQQQKLSDELERMKTITEAMWELLKEKTGLNDEELKKKISLITIKRANQAVRNCPKCERIISAKSAKCVFCGEPVEKTLIFD